MKRKQRNSKNPAAKGIAVGVNLGSEQIMECGYSNVIEGDILLDDKPASGEFPKGKLGVYMGVSIIRNKRQKGAFQSIGRNWWKDGKPAETIGLLLDFSCSTIPIEFIKNVMTKEEFDSIEGVDASDVIFKLFMRVKELEKENRGLRRKTKAKK